MRIEAFDPLAARLAELESHLPAVREECRALLAEQGALKESAGAIRASMDVETESAAERRRHIDELRAVFTEFDLLHTRCQGLTELLHTDTQKLAPVLERTAVFMQQVHGLSESIAALEARAGDVEFSTRRAMEAKAGLDEFAVQTDRMAPRFQLIEEVQARLNHLHELSAEIDRKLSAQLGRQASLDALRSACDGLSARLMDAQHNCEALESSQRRFAPLTDRVTAMAAEVAAVHAAARQAQADLAAAAEGHAQVAATRADLQRLLGLTDDLAARISDIETRGAALDDIRRRADGVVGLLDHMHVAIGTIAEQKAVVDQVSEQIARLDETIAEAHGTTRALQAERKLSQRIVDNLQSLHGRGAADGRPIE